MPGIILVYTTHSAEAAASALCNQLLEERLIACANSFPIQSAYHWQGALAQEGEYVAILKTVPELWQQVQARIEAIHPYDTPCILRMEVEANAAFALWVREAVRLSDG